VTLAFAFDGSIHADWISRYALSLAAALPQPALRLLCVEDSPLPRAALEQRARELLARCERQGLPADVELLPRRSDVAAAILRAAPRGAEEFLLCGTRVRPRQRGFLSGTVAEQLLRARPCNVLAIRVVQPGFMGHPRELLVPVSGHPRGFVSGLPFLRLLAPRVERLHLLLVKELRRGRFRDLRRGQADLLSAAGQDYLRRVEGELRACAALSRCLIQREVVVSDDAPKEIVIAASRLGAQLIYLGASERSLPHRFVYGNIIEQVLRRAPCDVAIYRGAS